jgi:tetratricopeptide (TPR) repeat protein
MGWWTDSANGRFVVSHGGFVMETQTALIVLPSQNFAIAIAMNFEGATPYPYARRLYSAALGEPWSINVYARNEKDRILLSGMDEAFDYGMRHLDQYHKPLTTDPKELSEAFAYFNRLAELPAKEAAEQAGRGRHPQADQAFVKMVSFIGAKLRERNRDKFNDYYRRGAISLFADYVKWYRTNPPHPGELRFSETFEKQVEQWNSDWTKTWNDETRKLEFTLTTDLKKTEKLLRDTFRGAEVYPNYASNLENLDDLYIERGEIEKALRAAQLSVDLYPDSASANMELGMTFIVAGNKEKAGASFKRASELDPGGDGSANSMNRFAYFLSEKGQTEAGLRLLETALEIYPREANLYDSAGEFYMKLGRQEKAIEFYTRALEIDSNYSNAGNARELLKKLRQQ